MHYLRHDNDRGVIFLHTVESRPIHTPDAKQITRKCGMFRSKLFILVATPICARQFGKINSEEKVLTVRAKGFGKVAPPPRKVETATQLVPDLF